MIKNNIDATIKDYFSIVDKEDEEDENESFEAVRIVDANANVKNLAIYGVTERDEFVKNIELEKVAKKRKRYGRYKNNYIV